VETKSRASMLGRGVVSFTLAMILNVVSRADASVYRYVELGLAAICILYGYLCLFIVWKDSE
jgi:hypothetical protein